MRDYIIETFKLSKIYKLKGHKKQIIALDDINLKIKNGEKFGLLGPNGAGKTTIVSILTTLLQPSSGYALIDGYNILKNPAQIKRRIGLVLGSDMIYYRITGYANLKFFCRIYQIPNYKQKIYEIAKELELDKWLNQYVSNYSSGMKIKLSLCRSFLTNPKILFLDEPTLGLDVKATKFVIEKLKQLDGTIFLTSHNMNVVEKLCDRVAFIDKGKIKRVGTREELGKILQKGIKIELILDKNINKLKETLDQQEYILKTIKTESGLILFLKNRIHYNALFSLLQNYPIQKFQEIDISIEELFLKII